MRLEVVRFSILIFFFQLPGTGENDSIDEDRIHHGSATLPGGCSLTSSSGGGVGGGVAGPKFGASDEGSECSSVTSESNSGALARSNRGHSAKAKSSSLHSNQETKPGDCIASSRSSENLEPILSELRLRREEVDRLRNKLENVKVRVSEIVLFFFL